jgi:phenylalanyl-tRNA synthetase beta chain
VFKDTKQERQSRNQRHAAAVWCNKTAGFEVIHGLLNRAMKMLEVPRIGSMDSNADTGYYVKESSGTCGPVASFLVLFSFPDPSFFPGRAATIYYRAPHIKRPVLASINNPASIVGRDAAIGTLGILHPNVLEKFDISYPCSALEFNLEPFKKEIV